MNELYRSFSINEVFFSLSPISMAATRINFVQNVMLNTICYFIYTSFGFIWTEFKLKQQKNKDICKIYIDCCLLNFAGCNGWSVFLCIQFQLIVLFVQTVSAFVFGWCIYFLGGLVCRYILVVLLLKVLLSMHFLLLSSWSMTINETIPAEKGGQRSAIIASKERDDVSALRKENRFCSFC